MKREAFGHTKMKRLCRRLDIRQYEAVGILDLLWDLTAREAPRGNIGKLSDEDIALALDFPGDESILIDGLVRAGWIDVNAEYRLLIHDWPDHCEDSVHMKIARARQFFADGSTPRLSRLSKQEKVTLGEFYRSVRTNDQSVRTESAQTEVLSPLPRPSSLEESTSVDSSLLGTGTFSTEESKLASYVPTEKKGVGKMESLDSVTAAVQAYLSGRFPDLDAKGASRIVQAARDVLPGLTLEILLQTFDACVKRDQRSAMLFEQTVPAYLKKRRALIGTLGTSGGSNFCYIHQERYALDGECELCQQQVLVVAS